VGLGEGAYRTSAKLASDLGQRALDDQAAEQLRNECFGWIAAVEKFLEARDALAPGPRDLLKALQQMPEDRAPAEEHARKTLALYIEGHRDNGAALFDRLVDDGYIIDTERGRIRSPKSRHDIQSTIHSIQLAAERIPQRR